MNRQLTALCDSARAIAESAHGLLIPVSGGTDSALAFWILNQVYPEKTVAVYAGDNLRCADWFESIGDVRFIDPPDQSEHAEIRRWAEFQIMAIEETRWLVGTRNRTEDVFGTYSLASRVATFLPLARVWKTTVMKLCDEVGVPSEIIASSQKADPECGRPQSLAEVPFEVIDGYLVEKLGGRIPSSFRLPDEAQREYLDGIFDYNRFKAKLPLRGAMVRTR